MEGSRLALTQPTRGSYPRLTDATPKPWSCSFSCLVANREPEIRGAACVITGTRL